MSQQSRMLRSSLALTKLTGFPVKHDKNGNPWMDISGAREYNGERYLDVTAYVDDEPHPEYGTVGSIMQDIGKERREAGEKGPKLGNLKEVGQHRSQPSQPSQPARSQARQEEEDDDDSTIPF